MKRFDGIKILSIGLGVILSFLTFSHVALAQDVAVGNIEELYSAVNSSPNAGATIVLSPGIYTLTANDPNGNPRANGGRLELQLDMSLLGVIGNRTAVVIEAANLPASSYLPGPSGAIRVGRGTNSIQWMTVRNARNGAPPNLANIESGLQMPGTAHITIAHVDSYGSTRAISIVNFGPGSSGETIEADIIDNDLHDNIIGVGEGIRFVNFQGPVSGTINARMIGNRMWGNIHGRFLGNNRAIDSTVNVFSSGNRMFANGAGTTILGGISTTATASNGNTIELDAHGDQFIDNTTPNPFDIGGLVVVGGENTSIPNGTNDNTVNVSLWGCRYSGNARADLYAAGARSNPESIGSPGVNNHVTIKIHGEGNPLTGRWQTVEFFRDIVPDNIPANNNTVTVIR
jgi:hypothetical protein